jgi:hypothetical protein
VNPDTSVRLGEEQVWLGQTYGRLFRVINRWGGMSMGNRIAGIIVVDVVADAIHNPTTLAYGDVARLAMQHLDTAIGRLTDTADRQRANPEAIYRATSPVYWGERLMSLIRWLVATTGRRIVTMLGAVGLAVISAFISGWAQAVFAR